ncbi:MAG: M10 family metallopeptidase C-terminal domain-containing protein [Cyanobium sp.]
MANPPGTIGNDFFISTADPFDLFNGQLGVDTVSYALASSGVSVNLNLAGFQAVGGGLGSDQLVSIENLIGSRFGDRLSGNAGSNELRGGLGNDLLRGSSGNDLLDGGDGIDTADYSGLGGPVRLGAFGTLAKGALGTDRLVGIETIIGSSGAGDTIDHSGAVAPALGTDTDLRSGAVSVFGSVAPLPLSFTVSQFENVIGSSFADTIAGNAGANTLQGGAGIDTVTYAGATAAVRVSLATTLAQNTLGDGVDTLSSFENLTGSRFNDTLTGDSGKNVISGGLGADVLTGGLGADVFGYTVVQESGLAAPDRITDFRSLQNDRIDLSKIDANVFLPGDQAFNWRGLLPNLNPPLALAVGELGYNTIGGNSFVYGRTSATADFKLQLDGVTSLNASHFVL